MNTPANYQLIPKSPADIIQDQADKQSKCCFHSFCWFFQISVWGLIIATVILVCLPDKNYIITLPILGVFYLVYFILELCSPTAKYLCNKSSDEGMNQKMIRFFRTPPQIKFYCECYHYETRTHTSTDSEGNTTTTTTTEKVVTHTETYYLPYYSVRDVSGLFYLNCDQAYLENKCYIKLQLRQEINFADSISIMDYEYQKMLFNNRNRGRDTHYDFYESRFIPGLTPHNLVRIGQKDPCSVNFCLLLLFTFLTFAEFYKAYVNSFCIEQKFKIRKIVSTRYNLNQPMYDEKYAALNPQINLISQVYKYEPKDYNYINDNYQVNLPTEEEIKRSTIYDNQVPEYQVSKEDGGQPGVIIDNPTYSNYGVNPAPAVTYTAQGNNNLNPNQINQNMNINTINTVNNNNVQYIPPNNPQIINNNVEINYPPKEGSAENMIPLITTAEYPPPQENQ